MNIKVFDNEKISLKNTINILILVMVLCGFLGFVYETLFYRIDLGYFIKRGSSFGPWIPIYAFGGLFITLATYKYKQKPIIVFLISCLVTGVLEYSTGWVLYEVFNTRLWDYNVEIWNFGNVNGYICARSILFFGVSSLFLIYSVIPNIQKFVKSFNESKITIISYILGGICAVDVLLYHLLK